MLSGQRVSETAIRDYATKWPQELVHAGDALSNEISRGIFVFLLEENKAHSFRELSEQLDVKHDLLSYHLSKLTAGGLVENTLEKRAETRDRSFYFVSEFGKVFADKQL